MHDLASNEFHIGIDDTDSPLGGCTTYTGLLILESLIHTGFQILDFPWLVRLNPNIPWKTRGNGAVALHFSVSEDKIPIVQQKVISIVKNNSDATLNKTDPAIVFLQGKIPQQLHDFSKACLSKVITPFHAQQICKKIGASSYVLKGSRGIVGALAAIGADLHDEDTFEVIAYRKSYHCGKPRLIDPGSVHTMDQTFANVTFNNLDPETGRILISPHGPDPVLFGIRGDDPRTLVEAARMIVTGEPVERVSIFRTNSGTDAHLQRQSNIGSLTRYQATVIDATVETAPFSSRGGHVFFKISDSSGSITCAAFRPTGHFCKHMLQLIPGDKIRASGGVQLVSKHGLTLNLEKLELLELAESIAWSNPKCLQCGKKCESNGRNQGFRCRKCSAHYPYARRIPIRKERQISAGTYMPPPRAHRHLTRPINRLPKQFSAQVRESRKDLLVPSQCLEAPVFSEPSPREVIEMLQGQIL